MVERSLYVKAPPSVRLKRLIDPAKSTQLGAKPGLDDGERLVVLRVSWSITDRPHQNFEVGNVFGLNSEGESQSGSLYR